MTENQVSPKPIKIFYSYAHEDEELRNKLEKHLKPLQRKGLIENWYDRKIVPGQEWGKEIDEHLEQAQIILLLVSADFLASDYCWNIEMKQALAKHEAGEARVIPIILRDLDWSNMLFGKLQALPKNAEPITLWKNEDQAFADVARGIRRTVEEIRHSSEKTAKQETTSQLLKDLKERHEIARSRLNLIRAELRELEGEPSRKVQIEKQLRREEDALAELGKEILALEEKVQN